MQIGEKTWASLRQEREQEERKHKVVGLLVFIAWLVIAGLAGTYEISN